VYPLAQKIEIEGVKDKKIALGKSGTSDLAWGENFI
jgi:hypothetical protein